MHPWKGLTGMKWTTVWATVVVEFRDQVTNGWHDIVSVSSREKFPTSPGLKVG